jgi:hypothetical protein
MSDDPCRNERDLVELLESELFEYEKLMSGKSEYSAEELKLLEDAMGLRPKSTIESELQEAQGKLEACEQSAS